MMKKEVNLVSKVLFVEGVPGSGKTTFSKRLELYFLNQGKHVFKYNEGDLNPLDYAWCSKMNEKTFHEMLEKYSNLKDQILENTIKYEHNYVTQYTKVKIDQTSKDFYQDFEPYEVYQSKDLQTIKQSHIQKWKDFSHQNDDAIYIFECVFFQNHLNELMLKFDVEYDDIVAYFTDLLEAIFPLQPTIIYLEPVNIRNQIDDVSNQRKTNDPSLYKDWIDLVIEYLQKTNYAKEKNYLGYDGFIRYLSDRINIEKKLLIDLKCSYLSYQINQNHDEVFQKLVNDLK